MPVGPSCPKACIRELGWGGAVKKVQCENPRCIGCEECDRTQPAVGCGDQGLHPCSKADAERAKLSPYGKGPSPPPPPPPPRSSPPNPPPPTPPTPPQPSPPPPKPSYPNFEDWLASHVSMGNKESIPTIVSPPLPPPSGHGRLGERLHRPPPGPPTTESSSSFAGTSVGSPILLVAVGLLLLWRSSGGGAVKELVAAQESTADPQACSLPPMRGERAKKTQNTKPSKVAAGLPKRPCHGHRSLPGSASRLHGSPDEVVKLVGRRSASARMR